MTGPMARASPAMAAHMPERPGAGRRAPDRAWRMMESVPGSHAAAPTPMIARAAMSDPVLGARAPNTEPPTNTTTPASITRLRPKRSPRVPKASMRLANTKA